ncbi:MAG: TonB-dependent receptor [Chloracidobacterium sp.]|nr:TonB-dependent receptor [Chloracidobacterium sp.]
MRSSASYKPRSFIRKESFKSSFNIAFGFLLSVFIAPVLWAQAPVGTISGIVTDPSGAVIKGAPLTVRNKATGISRQTKTENDGTYSAPALPAGDYEVEAQVQGFRTILREATVNVGVTVKVDLALEVGQTTEIVTVQAAGAAQIDYERHSVDGVITREKIQDLPLNGRSFLNLAFLEPGVTVSPGTTSQYNQLFSVSVLGGDSGKTAITVDGGNIRNSIEGGTGMNFSQEVVQEFQLSSANYDLSTGITSVGSVNVVSRSGGNQFHGSGYYFFRDHNMAAYPGLKRICDENPAQSVCANTATRKGVENPFFARRNPGVSVGGPIIKDRLFFFTNYEYMNQTQIFTVQPDLPSVSALAGNFASPYHAHLFSLKFDLKINDKHSLFARYSHDGNKGFGPSGGAVSPSNWLQNKNFADQSVLGVTSVLTPTLTNDFRFNYSYWQNRNLFADQTTCPDCLGLGFPQVNITGSQNFAVGNTSNATQGRDLRRFTFDDIVTWQKSSHRLRFGTEVEYAPGTGFWGFCDPGCVTLVSPETVTSSLPAALVAQLFPNLPTKISTNADLLNLPFGGGVVGLGDPSQPPPYNVDKAKNNNRLRFYGQDTWHIKPNFTLNYGLSWEFESTLVNRDLSKPQYLAPIYGSDLSPTNNNYHNFSPSLGFAWNVGKDNKTVIRAGAGIYYDTESLYRRLQERAFIGPLGNGRIQYPSTGFVNIFPGIVVITKSGITSLPIGASLPSGQLTNLTLGQYEQIVSQELPAVTAALTPTNPNDLSVRNIQISKSGAQLYPLNYPVQRSYQMDVGIQREITPSMVLTADYVRRVFTDTLLGEIDLNRFNRFINGVRAPVIPACASTAQVSDPTAECSTGGITFWVPGGRSVYNALLVKLDKRLTNRVQFTASYALTGQTGINGISNLDNYFANYGPQGSRHILNLSGVVVMPFGFELGLISSIASRGPVMPSISGVDLNGDGSGSEPIPGVNYNCFNRGCGKSDLQAAVQAWDTKYYPNGPPLQTFQKDARGQNIPYLTLPPNYSFGDGFSSQDIRLTKKFTWKEHYTLSVFGEMFNAFNVANLSGYNFTINSNSVIQGCQNPTSPQCMVFPFGQPTQRQSQVFGSGGPRAMQVGARVSF